MPTEAGATLTPAATSRAAGRPSKRHEHPGNRYFRLVVLSFLVMIVLMAAAGVVAFLFIIQGAEETMVPRVTQAELVDALLELQDRGLVPYVQLRYFSDTSLRGRVVEQEPTAGTLVRTGRRVTLVVSQGAVVDQVGDYIGRTLDDVRAELQILFASFRPLLQIGDVMYQFDDAEPGTILQQDPLPNAELTTLTNLDLVVSRGPEVRTVSLPAFTGISFDDAMRFLVRDNIPFVFTVGTAGSGRVPGHVYEQQPEAGAQVLPGSVVRLTIAPIAARAGRVFGVFSRLLPNYAVPIDLSFDTIDPDGRRVRQFTMRHPGGEVGIPYDLPANSVLVLSAFNSEILRTTVRETAP